MRYPSYMYDSSILPISAYGNDVNNVPLGKSYLDSSGILCRACNMFNAADGKSFFTDSALINGALQPTKNYRVRTLSKLSAPPASDVICSIGSGTPLQLLLGHYNNTRLASVVGGSYFEFINSSVNVLDLYEAELINTPNSYLLKYGGMTSSVFAHNASLNSSVFSVGARSNGSHAYNGYIAFVALYGADGYILECLDFTRMTSTTNGVVHGINGTPFTLRGSETSLFYKAGIPVSKLAY